MDSPSKNPDSPSISATCRSTNASNLVIAPSILPRPYSQSTARVSKLPERQLLSRYRHVYAGKGGWFVSRTSLTPPVNFNRSQNSQHLDVYRKELILRLSKDIFESARPTLNKNNVVSNQVIGDQRGTLSGSLIHGTTPVEGQSLVSNSEDVSSDYSNNNPHEKAGIGFTSDNLPSERRYIHSGKTARRNNDNNIYNEQDPENNNLKSGSLDINKGINESDITKGIGVAQQNANKSNTKVNNNGNSYRENSIDNDTHNKPQKDSVLLVSGELNTSENDNCFITAFKRSHTIIGTIHPEDIKQQNNQNLSQDTNQNKNTHKSNQLEVNKQDGISKDSGSNERKGKQNIGLHREKLSNTYNGENGNGISANRQSGVIYEQKVQEEEDIYQLNLSGVNTQHSREEFVADSGDKNNTLGYNNNTTEFPDYSNSTTENRKRHKKHRKQHASLLGEIEFNVLRQRSFVKVPSKMAAIELAGRQYTRGALTRAGKFLPTRMSQEALLAISETRKEMGIDDKKLNRVDSPDGDIIDWSQAHARLQPRDNPEPISNSDERSASVKVSPLDINSTSPQLRTPPTEKPVEKADIKLTRPPLQENSNESFGMDSNRTRSSGNKNQSTKGGKSGRRNASSRKLDVISGDIIREQLKKTALSKKSKKLKSTEATAISPELDLMPLTSLDKGAPDSARFSFNLSQDRQSPRGNGRYLSPTMGGRIASNGGHNNNGISSFNHNNASTSQTNVFNNVSASSRTKLPNLKLASHSHESILTSENGGIPVTPRSKKSAGSLGFNKIGNQHLKNDVHESEDSLGPLNFKTIQNFNKFPIGRPLALTKEKSFQITPPGWDVRYRDIYGTKVNVDFCDDTPEEVKERAIEKCSDWVIKYM